YMSFYQCMRAMKITMILINCLLVQVSASTHAQLITLNKQNTSIRTILLEIRKQSQYDFFYDTELFRNAKLVSIRVQNPPLREVFAICFANQPYNYVIKDKFVVVTALTEVLQTTAAAKQQLEIHGLVHDDKRRPLSGVSIRVKGTQTVSSSDSKGNFKIT